MSKLVTLSEVKSSKVTLTDIVRMNQLLDAQVAAEQEAYKAK